MKDSSDALDVEHVALLAILEVSWAFGNVAHDVLLTRL